jgi:hypothetical protein
MEQVEPLSKLDAEKPAMAASRSRSTAPQNARNGHMPALKRITDAPFSEIVYQEEIQP